eukprot:gene17869-biopygen5743
MFGAFHYDGFYAFAYAQNQWLALQGYH